MKYLVKFSKGYAKQHGIKSIIHEAEDSCPEFVYDDLCDKYDITSVREIEEVNNA